MSLNLADLIVATIPLPSFPLYLTHYENGRTPLSTWPSVLFTLAGYLAVIFGLQEVMRPRQPLKMTALFQLHNIMLSSGSLILLVLMVKEIVPIVFRRGLFYGICGKGAWTPVRTVDLSVACMVLRPRTETRVLLHDQLLYQIP